MRRSRSLRFERGAPPHPPSPPPQVPIGAKDGAGLLPFGTVGPRFTAMIKGKGLFLGKVAGGYGYSEAELVRQE